MSNTPTFDQVVEPLEPSLVKQLFELRRLNCELPGDHGSPRCFVSFDSDEGRRDQENRLSIPTWKRELDWFKRGVPPIRQDCWGETKPPVVRLLESLRLIEEIVEKITDDFADVRYLRVSFREMLRARSRTIVRTEVDKIFYRHARIEDRLIGEALADAKRVELQPNAVDPPERRRKNPADLLTKRTQAIALCARYPDWTDAQIAEAVGVARTTPYIWPEFMEAKSRMGKGRGRRGKTRQVTPH